MRTTGAALPEYPDGQFDQEPFSLEAKRVWRERKRGEYFEKAREHQQRLAEGLPKPEAEVVDTTEDGPEAALQPEDREALEAGWRMKANRPSGGRKRE